jgi:hypothetical protein
LLQLQHILLQFVLKHDKWRALREVEAYPSSMCPSHPEAVSVVTSLIKQVVEFHPDIQYLHIGADEVRKHVSTMDVFLLCGCFF